MKKKPSPAFADYRESIRLEKQARIEAHQEALRDMFEPVSEMQPLGRYEMGLAWGRVSSTTSTPPKRPLVMIAQGDSWFDYPLPPADVIEQLETLGNPSPIIHSLAHYGEATTSLLGVEKIRELEAEMQRKKNANEPLDAILFSGGGNDLVGDQFRLWLNDYPPGGTPQNALNNPRVKNIMGVIASAYEDLVAVRDKYAHGVPIFLHSYDFAQPDGRGALCGAFGPWLEPSLKDRGWNVPSDRLEIVKILLTQFDSFIASLPTLQNNVFHVKTQGTLNANHWDNELHPNQEGFKLITGKFLNKLRVGFPGRI